MTSERIEEIRARYRDQNGELNVSEDDPRYQTAVMSALDHDCAERGYADAVYGQPVLTEAKRLRDSYRDRIAEMRASVAWKGGLALGVGFVIGFACGTWFMGARVLDALN